MAANNLRMVPFGAWSGLDVLVEPDEGSALPPQDPFSMGLLQAIWSAMFAMTESAALWFALSPRTWAEIGDPQFTLFSAARRRRSNGSAGRGQRAIANYHFRRYPSLCRQPPSQTTLPSRSDRTFSPDAVTVLPRPAGRSPI